MKPMFKNSIQKQYRKKATSYYFRRQEKQPHYSSIAYAKVETNIQELDSKAVQ
jgi:hypothetical protein